MKQKYLHDVRIGIDYGFLPTDKDGTFLGDGNYVSNQLGTIHQSMFTPLHFWIDSALKSSKPCFGDPPVENLEIELSHDPAESPYFFGLPETYLVVQIAYDPRNLFDLEKDQKIVGELSIDFIERALEKLKDWPNFPFQDIRDACAQFRASNYAFPIRAGEKMIPGTRIKGRVNVEISCVGAIRYLTLLYRNKPLYQTIISQSDNNNPARAQVFAGFELNDNMLTVSAGPVLLELEGKPVYANGAEPVTIDLNAHPEALELIRKYSV